MAEKIKKGKVSEKSKCVKKGRCASDKNKESKVSKLIEFFKLKKQKK